MGAINTSITRSCNSCMVYGTPCVRFPSKTLITRRKAKQETDMFISRLQADAAAKAISDHFSRITGKPESFLSSIPTSAVHDGGSAAFTEVSALEAARRTAIQTAPAQAEEALAANAAEIETLKASIKSAGSDKVAVVAGRYSLAQAEARRGVLLAEKDAADAALAADNEAAILETKTKAAQEAAEASRLAVDSLVEEHAGRVDHAETQATEAVAAARRKHDEDMNIAKRAQLLKQADAI
jgi:hypothetical protein